MVGRTSLVALLVALTVAGALVCATALSAAPVPESGAKTEYGHNADYTRISGQLVWEQLEGGFWRIHYLRPKSPEAARDKHRGSFVLGQPKLLKDFKSGEWVRITGRVSPNQMSIWQAGTIYDVKTVRRIGSAPKPPALDPHAARLAAQAEEMRKTKLRFPADFAPARDLRVTWDKTKRQLLFILLHYRHDTKWSPQIIADEAAARAAVEKHIRANTGNYVHTFRNNGLLAEDEKIFKYADDDLYHRFDSSFKTTKSKTTQGRRYHMVYLVLRPAFLAKAVGQHTVWLGNAGRGLTFGKPARSDLERFTKAADLLAYLMLKDSAVLLLDRSTESRAGLLRWSGTLATYVKGPTSDRDWRFEQLSLRVVPETGHVTISRKPAPVPVAAGKARPGVDEDWQVVVGGTPAYQKFKAREVVLRGKLIARNVGKPGVLYFREPIEYFVETGARQVKLGPPMYLFAKFKDKRVEVKGKMRPIREGSRQKFLWVGWIRNVPVQ